MKNIIFIIALTTTIFSVWVYSEWVIHYFKDISPYHAATPTDAFMTSLLTGILWGAYKQAKEYNW